MISDTNCNLLQILFAVKKLSNNSLTSFHDWLDIIQTKYFQIFLRSFVYNFATKLIPRDLLDSLLGYTFLELDDLLPVKTFFSCGRINKGYKLGRV